MLSNNEMIINEKFLETDDFKLENFRQLDKKAQEELIADIFLKIKKIKGIRTVKSEENGTQTAPADN